MKTKKTKKNKLLSKVQCPMQVVDITDVTTQGLVFDDSAGVYPTCMHVVRAGMKFDCVERSPASCAYYGFVFGKAKLCSTAVDGEIKYSVFSAQRPVVEVADYSTAVVIQRFGFKPIEMVTRPELIGRLSYIDGCSDTILIPPPRNGDPCLNHLHFPVGIVQTQHTHPTIRMGIVVDGHGHAYCDDPHNSWEIELRPGMLFMLPAFARHSFRTDKSGSEMDIIAYHPDSSGGPTDENHPMLNRTYIKHGGGQ